MVRLVEEAITFYSILVLVLLTTTSAEATTGLGEEEDYDGRGHVNGLLEQPSSDNDGALLLRSPRSTLSDSVMMPGTNWCGRGWRAGSFDHLGTYGGADKCCRQHDLGCPFSIGPMGTQHGLHNWRLFTSMHCTCDERFRSCLKMANSAAANMVGRLFFNAIRTPCFVFSTSATCSEWTWWGKCIREEITRTAVWRPPISF